MKRLAELLVSWGPLGLFLFALADGAGVPVPGGVDALLVFLASQSEATPLVLALLAVVGSTIGNSMLFYLSRKGGELYLERHTLSRGGRKFREWFHHYGIATVFVSALIPLPIMPMKIFVICAGALGSSLRTFLIAFVSARVIRYSGLAYLGKSMGKDALLWLRLHAVDLGMTALAICVALFLLIRIADWWRARRVHA